MHIFKVDARSGKILLEMVILMVLLRGKDLSDGNECLVRNWEKTKLLFA